MSIFAIDKLQNQNGKPPSSKCSLLLINSTMAKTRRMNPMNGLKRYFRASAKRMIRSGSHNQSCTKYPHSKFERVGVM
jgi:hypothetical protein